jgi:membrane protease YdiL (CAAX protease family)
VASGRIHVPADIGHVQGELRAMLQQSGMPALLVILTLGVAAGITIMLAYRKWPSLWSMAALPGFGFTLPRRSAYFVLALAVGVAAPLLGGPLTHWLAHGRELTQDIQQLGANTPLDLRIPLALLVVSLGPLVEELLFRGVLLAALTPRWSLGWAVAISSLLFALIHLPGLQFQWYALLDLLLLAAALAWLRLRAGSIWPAVLAHGVNNLLGVLGWFVASDLLR